MKMFASLPTPKRETHQVENEQDAEKGEEHWPKMVKGKTDVSLIRQFEGKK